MAPAEPPGWLRVEVALSPAPRQVACVVLRLPVGSKVGDAVQASGLLERHQAGPAWPAGQLAVAVWGRLTEAEVPLRDHDRVELLRPLLVDPKEARRLRYRSQAERRGKRLR